jgi:hypothetical protein
MARYRPGRGATAGDVLLAVDRSKEEYKEMQAYERYLAQLRRQAKKKRKGGLLGSVLGAVTGFFLGGPAGMMLGWGVGGGVTKGVMGYEQFKKSRKSLGSHVWEGGKFDYSKTRNLRDKEKEAARKLKRADMTGAAIDIALGATGYAAAGGTAAAKAWRASDMTLGQKLGTLFSTEASTEASKEALKASADTMLKEGSVNVLDLVKQRNAILDGGLFAQGIGKGLGKVVASPWNASSIGQLNRMITAGDAIKSGNIPLSGYLLSDYYDALGSYSKQQ